MGLKMVDFRGMALGKFYTCTVGRKGSQGLESVGECTRRSLQDNECGCESLIHISNSYAARLGARERGTPRAVL